MCSDKNVLVAFFTAFNEGEHTKSSILDFLMTLQDHAERQLSRCVSDEIKADKEAKLTESGV